MFSYDIFRAYKQLPLDPADWPLVYLKVSDSYYVDMSLPFGL